MIADREKAKFKTFQDRPLDLDPRESALIRGKKPVAFLRASASAETLCFPIWEFRDFGNPNSSRIVLALEPYLYRKLYID